MYLVANITDCALIGLHDTADQRAKDTKLNLFIPTTTKALSKCSLILSCVLDVYHITKYYVNTEELL